MTTTLVLGGVRSGKSRHAEALLRGEPRVRYVATAQRTDESDPTWATRVEDHRARRPDAWETVETIDVAGAIRSASIAGAHRLPRDLAGADDRPARGMGGPRCDVATAPGAGGGPPIGVGRGAVDVVAVTNEVGLGVVPPSASGRLFRDELGRLNTALSAASDRVHLVVAGRVLDLSHAPVVDE